MDYMRSDSELQILTFRSDKWIGLLRPILIQSDWGDKKGRFPIQFLFDGMCLDAFVIVSRIEFVVIFLVFVLFLWAFGTRE